MLTDLKKHFPLYLISLYPVALILGTLVSELITFILIFIFLYKNYLNKNWKWIGNFYFKCLSIIWLYLIVNFLLSSHPENSFLRAIGFIRFPILIFALKFFFQENLKYYTLVFKIWFGILAIVIFDLYFQYIFGHNILNYTGDWTQHGFRRLTSFMVDEYRIVHLLYGFIFLVIAFIINKKHSSVSAKFLISLLVILSILIIVLANERSNTIRSIIIIFLFFVFLDKQFFKPKKILLLSTFLIVLISFLSNDYLKQRYFKEFYVLMSNEKNFQSIIKNTTYGAHYYTGIKIFKDNPLIGSGLKTFRIECHKEKYIDETLKFEGCSTHPHQIYIEFLSEIGLLGTLLIILFIFYTLVRNFKIYLLKKNPIHLASILFIISIFIPLIPSGSFFTSFGATIFWINYGVMIFFEEN